MHAVEQVLINNNATLSFSILIHYKDLQTFCNIALSKHEQHAAVCCATCVSFV